MTGPAIGSRWRRRSTGVVGRVVWICDGALLTDVDGMEWPVWFFLERWDPA